MIRGMILAESCQPCVKITLYHLCFAASMCHAFVSIAILTIRRQPLRRVPS
jgi:hypothetical protein